MKTVNKTPYINITHLSNPTSNQSITIRKTNLTPTVDPAVDPAANKAITTPNTAPLKKKISHPG
jgi:hypothetical protein